MIRKKQSRLLVESILRGDTKMADRLLAKMITEAEDERQDEAKAEAQDELGLDDDQEEDNASDDFDAEGEDLDDGDEFEELDAPPTSDEFAPQDTMESDTELNELVDKQVNFEVQVNNLVLNDLQNKCANLKTALENNASLDKHSREYYEIQVPLQYYGDTLNNIQKDITPLVNQDEIKKQLDEISSSLDKIADEIGVSDELTISTPDEVLDEGNQF